MTMITTKIKTYSEVILIPSFEERFEYLKTESFVGDQTFGGRRYLNQRLYQSDAWKRARRNVIIRDNGCDLAHPDHPIYRKLFIHHIEPITIEDILQRKPCIFDEDNLICISYETHNALHYGNSETLAKPYVERRKNDTCPWR